MRNYIGGNMNDENQTLIEIRERLVRIETILASQDYRAVELKANEALEKAKKNEKEIENIRSTIKWVEVTVIGAVLVAVVNILINYAWK